MQAIVYDRYGSPDVLRLEDIETPTTSPDRLLIRVHAASVNSWDWDNLTGKSQARPMSGLLRPKRRILGADVAGTVESVGANVTRFRPGDEVFGDLCASGWGGFAEFVSAPETALTHKPRAMSFEQAAAIPQAGVMALQAVRDYGALRAGQHLLINGAGGGVGTFAIQLAKAVGAEVTGVDATHKLDFLRRLGVDRVIDFEREDLADTKDRFDVMIDVCAKRSMFDYRRLLRPSGRYVLIGGDTARILQSLVLQGWMKLTGSPQQMGILMHEPNKSLGEFDAFFQSGAVVPIVDRLFPLSRTADALRWLGEGHSLGKVVVTIPG